VKAVEEIIAKPFIYNDLARATREPAREDEHTRASRYDGGEKGEKRLEGIKLRISAKG